MASCPHYSSLCLSVVFSFCLGLSLTRRSSLALSLSLSRARALTLARRLIYICALEDTIGIPTCWNGVLQSPSVIVSSHLWLSLSVSVSVPHSSRSACGWFCQARAAQQGQTRVTLGSLAHPSVLRPHSRLCSAAPAPQAVQRCSVTRLWHRGPAKPISRSARFSARLLHGLAKEALEGLHQILGGPRLHKPPNAGRQPHRLQLAQGRHPG